MLHRFCNAWKRVCPGDALRLPNGNGLISIPLRQIDGNQRGMELIKQVMAAVIGGLMLTACGDVTTTQASADRNVTIINNTGATISRFYGSNAGSDSWEEDILGADVLPAGSRVNINFDDGSGYCTFDFKAEFADGSSSVERGVDVCTTGSVTFN